tara:strand:+ start:114 stop:257 length:144 start_codon:yes stop_codon:yes gene_type:complete
VKDSFDSWDMSFQAPIDCERSQERMKRNARRNAKQERKRKEDYSDED